MTNSYRYQFILCHEPEVLFADQKIRFSTTHVTTFFRQNSPFSVFEQEFQTTSLREISMNIAWQL